MMSIMMLLVPLAGIPCSIIVGKWCDRKGCRMPTVLALGLRLMFCVIFAIINPEWGILAMAIGIVITGMSYGTSGSAQFTRAIHHCEPEYRVDGSSVVNIFNQLSMAFGLIFYMLIFSFFGMNIINIDVSVITAEEMTECFQFAAVIGIIISIVTLILALVVRNIVPEQESETVSESRE
jgi:MFS family permease